LLSQIYLFFVTKQGFRTSLEWHLVGEMNWDEGGRDVELATLCSLTAPHRVPFPLWEAAKEKRDSNGAAEAEHL
jgi:hypothetical protein